MIDLPGVIRQHAELPTEGRELIRRQYLKHMDPEIGESRRSLIMKMTSDERFDAGAQDPHKEYWCVYEDGDIVATVCVATTDFGLALGLLASASMGQGRRLLETAMGVARSCGLRSVVADTNSFNPKAGLLLGDLGFGLGTTELNGWDGGETKLHSWVWSPATEAAA